jgi:hypothetical protein
MNINVTVHHIIGLSSDVWLLVFIFAVGFSAVALYMLYPTLVPSSASPAGLVEEPVARQPMGFRPS